MNNPYKVSATLLSEIGNLSRNKVTDTLHSVTLYGKSVRKEIDESACTVFQLENETGTGKISIYQVFSEIEKATKEYDFSIEEIQVIIENIEQSANIFVEAVSNIRSQINEVQNIPGNDIIGTEEVMAKVGEIEKTTDELSAVVDLNRDNVVSIRKIVERFSL